MNLKVKVQSFRKETVGIVRVRLGSISPKNPSWDSKVYRTRPLAGKPRLYPGGTSDPREPGPVVGWFPCKQLQTSVNTDRLVSPTPNETTRRGPHDDLRVPSGVVFLSGRVSRSQRVGFFGRLLGDYSSVRGLRGVSLSS